MKDDVKRALQRKISRKRTRIKNSKLVSINSHQIYFLLDFKEWKAWCDGKERREKRRGRKVSELCE